MWQLVLAVIALAIAHWLSQRRRHYEYFKNLDIPGPEPSIFFGNMVELYQKTPLVAHREWIAKYGKTLGYFDGYRPVLLVADPELMKMIQIKDFQDFIDRGLLFQPKRPRGPERKSLIQLQGKRWKEVRSVLTPSFTSNKLRLMSTGMIEKIEELVKKVDDYARKGEEFEASDMYQALTLDVISRSAMGIDQNIQRNPESSLLASSRTLFSGGFSPAIILHASFPGLDFLLRFLVQWRLKRLNNGVHPFKEVVDKCKGIVQSRQKDATLHGKDLLQLMIDAKHSKVDFGNVTSEQLTAGDEAEAHELRQNTVTNGLTSSKAELDDDDITQNAFLVLVAGYETTSNTLTLITHMLVNYPEVQEKIREELFSVIGNEGEIDYSTTQKLTYLNCVISECLRLYPPIFSFITREAVVDKQYGKLRIPTGTTVMISVDHVHRDPNVWEDPLKFDPDRFLPENKSKISPVAWQPFGAGPRNCIGMRFAQMELRLAIAKLLRKYRLQATENTEKDPPEIEMNPLVLRIKKGVHIKAVPLEVADELCLGSVYR
ncbi:cytochrome P450 3A6-like [Ornithodoros turicata]|uniref:cytochrome P450 3A6-like n=1 Tax=Ornithodoros turicata TaxID=34597 RepID=UPI00313A4B51